MEKYFAEREQLNAMLETEWLKYRQTISDNKPFHEAKTIYLRIKNLQQQMDNLTNEIHERIKPE